MLSRVPGCEDDGAPGLARSAPCQAQSEPVVGANMVTEGWRPDRLHPATGEAPEDAGTGYVHAAGARDPVIVKFRGLDATRAHEQGAHRAAIGLPRIDAESWNHARARRHTTSECGGADATTPGGAPSVDGQVVLDVLTVFDNTEKLRTDALRRRGVAVADPHEHVALVHLDLETLEATPLLPDDWDGDCDGTWIDGETYVARVNSAVSRGRVVTIPASTSRGMPTWRELVPEGEGCITWAGVVAGRLYVGDLINVSVRVRVFDLDGKLIETLPLENPGSTPSLDYARAIRPLTDAFTFTHETFTRSESMILDDPETGELHQIREAKHWLDDTVAEQRFATSRDGTRVPCFMVYRKDLDLSRPQLALVFAYGGFNTSMLPSFPTLFVPFIEAGGIFVLAPLRGGGEYGRAWHDGGRLENKRNTFDDLEAVVQALIADGASAPDRAAFHGLSNGGLTAGAAIVFQPHLWRVVVPAVAVYDVMETLPVTADTAWVRSVIYEDWGNPTVPEVARSVIQWSPYHNIKDGVVYPAVFQVFGAEDSMCRPFQARKFTARLEEANVGDRPIHMRVWRDTGHAPGSQAAEYTAEWLAFVMDQVGLTAKGARR